VGDTRSTNGKMRNSHILTVRHQGTRARDICVDGIIIIIIIITKLFLQKYDVKLGTELSWLRIVRITGFCQYGHEPSNFFQADTF
jgi:hypothetical protein